MLDMNKTAKQQLKLVETYTDIANDIFEPVRSMFLSHCFENFEFLISGRPQMLIWVDRMRLKQVVLNLVGNSQTPQLTLASCQAEALKLICGGSAAIGNPMTWLCHEFLGPPQESVIQQALDHFVQIGATTHNPTKKNPNQSMHPTTTSTTSCVALARLSAFFYWDCHWNEMWTDVMMEQFLIGTRVKYNNQSKPLLSAYVVMSSIVLALTPSQLPRILCLHQSWTKVTLRGTPAKYAISVSSRSRLLDVFAVA